MTCVNYVFLSIKSPVTFERMCQHAAGRSAGAARVSVRRQSARAAVVRGQRVRQLRARARLPPARPLLAPRLAAQHCAALRRLSVGSRACRRVPRVDVSYDPVYGDMSPSGPRVWNV